MITVPAPEAREAARRILEEDRFHETHLPRPFARPLDWLGDRLDALFGDIPGGPALGWLVVSAVVLSLAVVVGLALARRRGPSAAFRPTRTRTSAPADPRRLERQADAAEQAGDLERALRLRFRAGVLRLAERRLVDDPDGVTTGRLRRLLRSPDFDAAASAFDEVVYGRRPATTEDARLARAGWQAALAVSAR